MKIKTTLRDLSMAIELMKEMQANHEARKHVDNNKNIPFDYKGAIEFALEMRNETLYYELKDNYGIDFEVGLNENDTYEFIMKGVQTEALGKKQDVEMENIYNQDKEVIGTRPKTIEAENIDITTYEVTEIAGKTFKYGDDVLVTYKNYSKVKQELGLFNSASENEIYIDGVDPISTQDLIAIEKWTRE